MSAKNNKKDFIINALGLTLNSFNSLFFLIIVRYINGIDVAGIFTYTFALCSLFYIVAIYFNRSFQVSDSKNRFSFNDYFTCRIITSAVSLVLTLAFALINNFSFFELSIILLLMLFRITESISDCFYGEIHKKAQLYKTGISLSAKALIGLLTFLITDLISRNLPLSIAILVITNVAIFFIYDLPNFQKLCREKVHFSLINFKIILKTCFPVFIFSALSLYLANCQKYILPYFEPNEIQTIFGILIMPATMLSLVGSYLINPTLSTFTKHYENRNFKAYAKLSQKILGIIAALGIIVAIACYLFGIPILELIYQIDLSSYQFPLVIIIIAAVFFAISMIISSLLTVLKENRSQSYAYLATAVISTIISVILIQTIGIFGAIYAFLISSLILVFLYIILLQSKLHKLRSPDAK